jgi:thiamine pyrophosphokinase
MRKENKEKINKELKKVKWNVKQKQIQTLKSRTITSNQNTEKKENCQRLQVE